MAHASWGPGWPNCQRDKIVNIDVNGVRFPPGVREEIAELVALLVEETVERTGYQFGNPGDPDYGCWGFACRAVTGTTRTPSNHSWGLAVDINAPRNPYRRDNRLITDMPVEMQNLWKNYGFAWGGDYRTVKDPMHYEFMASVEGAAMLTAKAKRDFGKNVFVPAPLPVPKPTVPPPPVVGDQLPLKQGARGANVTKVQSCLRIKQDGIYGPHTEARVRIFQKARGLTADGIVGGVTWRVMFNSTSQFRNGHVYRRVMYYGATNSDSVRNLQARLNSLGFDCGRVDGNYGAKTKRAVASFQVSEGWSGSGADGHIAYPRTRTGGKQTVLKLFTYASDPYQLHL